MIRLDYSHALLKEDIFDYQARVDEIHETIVNRTAKGSDF